MAIEDKKTEELTPATTLDGTELIHIVQGGNSRQANVGGPGAGNVGLKDLFQGVAGFEAKTSAYSVVAGDNGKRIDVSGTWTLSLVAAATAGSTFKLYLYNNGTGLITIDPNGAELIDGASTLLLLPGRRLTLSCTGTAWETDLSDVEGDFVIRALYSLFGVRVNKYSGRAVFRRTQLETRPWDVYARNRKNSAAWVVTSASVANQWNQVMWVQELGLFVAVAITGTGDRVMTSPDGITWTTRTSAADNAWSSLAWSPELGLLVAVSTDGTGNRVMTSPDGITWTIRTSAADNQWNSVTWSPELGLFVACAVSGTADRIMTSPDGITWTTRTTANNQWRDVRWIPELGLFVSVAATGTGNRVMTSPDGITWTLGTTPADLTWQRIAYSPELGLLVAVAASGTGNRVMTSPDGLTWTSRTSATDNDWRSVTWSPQLGLFLAVASTGTGDRVMTSPDGITWTSRTSAQDSSWRSVVWSRELGYFVAVAVTGTNLVMKSMSDRDQLLALKAALVSPAFTGNPTAPTQSAGDNSTKLATTAYADTMAAQKIGKPFEMIIAVSDETTTLTAGTSKVTFRMPAKITLSAVRASVNTAPTGATLLTVDINEAGVSILSTKLTFDATEKTTTTAATPAVISDTGLADDAEITIDIDSIGSTVAGAGLKVTLIGVYS